MPGMNSGLNIANPILVAAFRAALMHQGLVALLILAILAIAWSSAREWLPRLTSADASAGRTRIRPNRSAEPAGRSLLRVGFGLLWILDGILQAQPAMAAGLPSKVIAPAAASSPSWVQHVANWAGTAWSYHPIQASAAAVWIQVGIGVWLLAAARGPWSRAAGLASAGWGLLVWVFGEAFGGVFAPGLTVLFGAPGAALFYCAAGGLVALPERFWQTPAFGRRLVSGFGLFVVGVAVLQAWPGRGYWQGTTAHGRPGSLTVMVRSMADTPQPSVLARWVSDFAAFTAQHGFAVNLVAVVVLAATGGLLLTRQARLIRPAIAVLAVFCLADWVLIEDVGFLGGLGTDPNNMVPLLLVGSAGYLAMTRLPAAAPELAAVPPATPAAPQRDWRDLLQPRRLARAFASAQPTGILAGWAAAVVLIGAAPMALAQASPNADPIIAQAIDGANAPINFVAPGFALTDQDGRQVSLSSLRGKVVLMTFLDPVCTSDCPLIASEFRAADQMLGRAGSAVRLVAIAANPLYYTAPYLQAFDRQERLTGVANWLFLTGSLDQLRQVWRSYGISAVALPAGQMIAHNDLAFVIDPSGHVRTELNFDPGPGTTSSQSSFAVELSQAAERVMPAGRSLS